MGFVEWLLGQLVHDHCIRKVSYGFLRFLTNAIPKIPPNRPSSKSRCFLQRPLVLESVEVLKRELMWQTPQAYVYNKTPQDRQKTLTV